MGITRSANAELVHELVVDPPCSADLVVNGAGCTFELRLSGLSTKDDSRIDGWRCAGSVRDMVVELLGTCESDPLGKFGPRIREASMYENAIRGSRFGSSTRTTSRLEG